MWKYSPLKLFLFYSFSKNKICKKGQREGEKASVPEYQGFKQPQFKDNQIQKQSWRILWKKCSWKLGTILAKEACKGIHYLGKLP